VDIKKRISIIVLVFLGGLIIHRLFFSKVPGEVKTLSFDLEDYDRDVEENLKTQDLMLKACGI
jgi:hypothetical protein